GVPCGVQGNAVGRVELRDGSSVTVHIACRAEGKDLRRTTGEGADLRRGQERPGGGQHHRPRWQADRECPGATGITKEKGFHRQKLSFQLMDWNVRLVINRPVSSSRAAGCCRGFV